MIKFRKKIVRDSTRQRLLDYFSTHTGRHNALSKNEMLIMDNGTTFLDNLDIQQAEDREIYRRAWQRICQATNIINKSSKLIKISCDWFITEQGNVRKWFSVDRRPDDKEAAGKRKKMSEAWKKSAERFEQHADFIEPEIFEEETEKPNFEKPL